jgi:hypothetical protein
LEIIGAIEPGGAVPIGGAHFAQGFDQVRHVLGAVEEHDVFEEVREAGLTLRLILGADIVPSSNRNDRRLAILMHEHGQAVIERETLIRNLDAFEQLRHRRRLIVAGGGRAGCGATAQHRRKHQSSRKRALHSPLLRTLAGQRSVEARACPAFSQARATNDGD